MDAERKARLHGQLDGLMSAYATILNSGKRDALAKIDQQIKSLEAELPMDARRAVATRILKA